MPKISRKKIISIVIFYVVLTTIALLNHPFSSLPAKPIDIKQTQETTETPKTSIPQNIREKAIVKRVVDGDTIELATGQKVRYIGIDTPETVKPNTPVECFGKEASNKNKELVEGKEVELEKDVSETDRYGRLLRYVYVDGLFVNDYLVSEGYAHAATFPPDVKFQELFKETESKSREQNKGLWAICKTGNKQ